MPRSIRYRSRGIFSHSMNFIHIALIFVLVVISVLLFVFYRQWAPKLSQLLIPSWQKTQQMRTIRPLPTDTLSQKLNEEMDEDELEGPTQTSTITLTPEPTETVTETLVPINLALDTPIGGDIQFIIHRVLPGESLLLYAGEYDTSLDAITAVNYNLPAVLYADLIVVIPIGIDDPVGLPQFEAFRVTMRGYNVDSLAEELSANPESLSKYNNVPMDYKFNPGDWILVPRE